MQDHPSATRQGRDFCQGSQARYLAKVDECNESVVQQFKGLLAYAIGTGSASAGLRYLYDTCLDFDRAKGNFELRQACYDSFQSLTGPVTESLGAGRNSRLHDPHRLRKHQRSRSEEFLFQESPRRILAAHDRQIVEIDNHPIHRFMTTKTLEKPATKKPAAKAQTPFVEQSGKGRGCLGNPRWQTPPSFPSRDRCQRDVTKEERAAGELIVKEYREQEAIARDNDLGSRQSELGSTNTYRVRSVRFAANNFKMSAKRAIMKPSSWRRIILRNCELMRGIVEGDLNQACGIIRCRVARSCRRGRRETQGKRDHAMQAGRFRALAYDRSNV